MSEHQMWRFLNPAINQMVMWVLKIQIGIQIFICYQLIFLDNQEREVFAKYTKIFIKDVYNWDIPMYRIRWLILTLVVNFLYV